MTLKKLFSFAVIAALSTTTAIHAEDSEPVETQEAAEAEAAPAPPSKVDTALSKMSSLYAKRDQGTNTQDAINLLKEAIKEDPNHYEVRWQLARFIYWQADTTSNDDKKAKLGKACWDEAEVAKKLNPKGVEGYYWAAACVGAYSEGSGILNAVKQGLADVFEENAKKAEKINGSHDRGGPLRALGRFYFKLPWPLKDKDLSRSYLERAIKAGPTSARNFYYMADLELDDGNKEEAKALLQKIISMNPKSGDPPDVRLHQKLARAKLAEL